MGDGNYFKGTSAEQDVRFGDKQKKLLRTLNFPKVYSKKVDIKKVNIPVIKAWVTKELQRIMGDDDDVLSNLVINFLDGPEVDPRIIHINLSGFLESNTAKFVENLWNFLLSAQTTPSGIPQMMLDEKKKEISENRIEHFKIALNVKKVQDESATIRSTTHKDKHNNLPTAYIRSHGNPDVKGKENGKFISHRDNDYDYHHIKSHRHNNDDRDSLRHTQHRRDDSYERHNKHKRRDDDYHDNIRGHSHHDKNYYERSEYKHTQHYYDDRSVRRDCHHDESRKEHRQKHGRPHYEHGRSHHERSRPRHEHSRLHHAHSHSHQRRRSPPNSPYKPEKSSSSSSLLSSIEVTGQN